MHIPHKTQYKMSPRYSMYMYNLTKKPRKYPLTLTPMWGTKILRKKVNFVWGADLFIMVWFQRPKRRFIINVFMLGEHTPCPVHIMQPPPSPPPPPDIVPCCWHLFTRRRRHRLVLNWTRLSANVGASLSGLYAIDWLFCEKKTSDTG